MTSIDEQSPAQPAPVDPSPMRLILAAHSVSAERRIKAMHKLSLPLTREMAYCMVEDLLYEAVLDKAMFFRLFTMPGKPYNTFKVRADWLLHFMQQYDVDMEDKMKRRNSSVLYSNSPRMLMQQTTMSRLGIDVNPLIHHTPVDMTEAIRGGVLPYIRAHQRHSSQRDVEQAAEMYREANARDRPHRAQIFSLLVERHVALVPSNRRAPAHQYHRHKVCWFPSLLEVRNYDLLQIVLTMNSGYLLYWPPLYKTFDSSCSLADHYSKRRLGRLSQSYDRGEFHRVAELLTPRMKNRILCNMWGTRNYSYTDGYGCSTSGQRFDITDNDEVECHTTTKELIKHCSRLFVGEHSSWRHATHHRPWWIVLDNLRIEWREMYGHFVVQHLASMVGEMIPHLLSMLGGDESILYRDDAPTRGQIAQQFRWDNEICGFSYKGDPLTELARAEPSKYPNHAADYIEYGAGHRFTDDEWKEASQVDLSQECPWPHPDPPRTKTKTKTKKNAVDRHCQGCTCGGGDGLHYESDGCYYEDGY